MQEGAYFKFNFEPEPPPAFNGKGPLLSQSIESPTLSHNQVQPKTIVIYRKMSAAEAAKTIESKTLQPKIENSNGKKYLSESLKMVQEFENKGVPQRTEETIVEFTLDRTKYEAMLRDRVHQDAVRETPRGRSKIEFHYENLPENGPQINIGVPENRLPSFNKAIIRVRELPKAGG